MAIPGKQLNNVERGTLIKKCVCGKQVEMIRTKERVSFRVPAEVSGHKYKIMSHTFVMKENPNGLCERCRRYGIPEQSSAYTRKRDYKHGGPRTSAYMLGKMEVK